MVGLLVGTAASTVLSYALRPYRPRFSLARSSDLVAFSGWLSLATVATTLSMETDRIIVGALLGIAEAGLYFMTVSVGVLPTRELVSPLQRMLFPSFSELAADRERLRRAAVESVNVLGSLGLAAGCGFALVANDFVPLALGGRWRPIVPLLVVLVPYLGLRATLSMALPCVMALGRTRLLAGVSLAYAVVHLPVFVAGTALLRAARRGRGHRGGRRPVLLAERLDAEAGARHHPRRDPRPAPAPARRRRPHGGRGPRPRRGLTPRPLLDGGLLALAPRQGPRRGRRLRRRSLRSVAARGPAGRDRAATASS